LISAVNNELFFNLDQYGEHSNGRSNEERGVESLVVVAKKQSNKFTWTIVQQGLSKEECYKILDGLTTVGQIRGNSIYKSPQFPNYILKRYHYVIMRYIFV
jgi:hypothetical protein